MGRDQQSDGAIDARGTTEEQRAFARSRTGLERDVTNCLVCLAVLVLVNLVASAALLLLHAGGASVPVACHCGGAVQSGQTPDRVERPAGRYVFSNPVLERIFYDF